MNAKPSAEHPALVPLVPCVGKDSIWYDELEKMEESSDWKQAPPLLSHDLISKFLGRVHSFTTVGLEAQATAFSFHADGVIRYLALLPQHNRVSSVEDWAGDITELNAVEAFAAGDHRPGDGYIQRCWIHTHPRFKAFMSSIDIFQMFLNTKTNPSSFGIVISPRDQV